MFVTLVPKFQTNRLPSSPEVWQGDEYSSITWNVCTNLRGYTASDTGRRVMFVLDSSWNVMANGDAREGKWRGKLANGVGSQYSSHYLGTWCIQHYYCWCAHLDCQQSTELTSPAVLNGLVRFARKTKSGFCTCAIIFELASTTYFGHVQDAIGIFQTEGWEGGKQVRKCI